MENLVSVLEQTTDKDGYVDMDKLLVKYSSPKSTFVIDMIYRYMIKNNVPFKMMYWGGGDNLKMVIINPINKKDDKRRSG